jgi:hypothetical protein
MTQQDVTQKEEAYHAAMVAIIPLRIQIRGHNSGWRATGHRQQGGREDNHKCTTMVATTREGSI